MTERVILPRTATEEMWEAGESAVSESFSMKYGKRAAAREIYNAMLAASPNAGEVSAEELEKAAKAIWDRANEDGTDPEWDELTDFNKEQGRDLARAALSSLGIKVGG